MENLMNINSNKLFTSEIFNASIGDLIHQKGERITDWGKTWKVEKITPKQVHCVLESLWYPVFDKTAFGRVADGEDKDSLKWLKECEKSQKGNRRTKFWKTGKEVGEQVVSHVTIF
jgi:hypothetical protein